MLIDDLIAEIDASQEVLEPQHEGLKDFARLNLSPATLEEVNLSIAQYERRLLLMQAAEDALQALKADGYPEMEPREIPDAAFEDLQKNVSTIQAAFGQFNTDEAVMLRTRAGLPEFKPAALPESRAKM